MIIIISASLFMHVKGYSQITGIYTDEEGNQYAVIYSTGLPESRVENRSENSTFYTNIQLYDGLQTVKTRTLSKIAMEI